MRGWRNTVEIVLFEISNSMKTYTPVVRAHTGKLRPAIGFVEPHAFDEASNRIPPTAQNSERPKLSRLYIRIYIDNNNCP